MSSYDFTQIEAKWQAYWDEHATFRTPNPGEPGFVTGRPKFYVIDMFPYPSGAGLHIGHPLGYTATDILARYRRTRGFNVLHPMGFDAFGLPAEQYAVETGTHPRATTAANIDNIRRQLRALGLSVDWGREVATIDVDYYRWTQWIFLQLFGSWFDRESDRARPMADLVSILEKDERRIADSDTLVSPGHAAYDGARKWSELDPAARRAVLDSHRLAYLDEIPVNWCPALGTVLANEEVTNEGRSERGNHPVYKRPLRQWMLRITAYAERLLADLDGLDWPQALKLMQRNWIGRSEGARARFAVVGSDAPIEVFTTRPDTLFGATYMVLAPEHPLVDAVTTDAQRERVSTYRTRAASRSDIDRQAEVPEKTGVFTGGHAVNPVSGEQVPIWIADYVLMGYGTGAIMAVPAHDSRDFEFALTFDLPLRAVVEPPLEWLREHASAAGVDPADAAPLMATYRENPASFTEAYTGEGVGLQSANDTLSLDGLPTPEAKARITDWLAERGLGRGETQYKLRDWLFSRQRFWGEPFPILHGPDGEVRAVDEQDLPVLLPDLEDYRPRQSDDPNAPPQPALSRADESWKQVEVDGITYERELSTMPQWAGSCWYYLRYIDPRNADRLVDPHAEAYWMDPRGIDLYVGGVEHAVLHLLYARFWHKVLYDRGVVSTPEPFQRLFNQGYILAFAYQDERGMYVDATEVTEEPDGTFHFEGRPVTRTHGKMGKSLKNSVTPDEVIAQYGADTVRLYMMYMGPLDQSKIWDARAIIGVHRFLQRVWRNLIGPDTGDLLVTDDAPTDELRRQLHRTIESVTDDLEEMQFNTAISRLIELNNSLVGLERVPREIAEPLVIMLSPLAPHIAEELWQRLGHPDSVAYVSWPEADPAYLVTDRVTIVVQVMGKKRGTIEVPATAEQATIEAEAKADPAVARHLEGKTIRKVIHVPGKLVNIVAS